MSAPAYTRDLIARRNSGAPTDSAFIAVGWPSARLREFVDRSPLNRKAVILATPEPKVYQFSAVVGLSCCIWIERSAEAPRAAEIAAMVMPANPLRLFTLDAVTGETHFYCVASGRRAAA